MATVNFVVVDWLIDCSPDSVLGEGAIDAEKMFNSTRAAFIVF